MLNPYASMSEASNIGPCGPGCRSGLMAHRITTHGYLETDVQTRFCVSVGEHYPPGSVYSSQFAGELDLDHDSDVTIDKW